MSGTIWNYKGLNSFGRGRDQDLALHPTVKPVAMIADAIKDVSKRGDIVLDLFGGSGSTLIAAHKTGRRGFLCELDPLYCDLIVRRWQEYAKDDAVLIQSAIRFYDIADQRTSRKGNTSSKKESFEQTFLKPLGTDVGLSGFTLPLENPGTSSPKAGGHE